MDFLITTVVLILAILYYKFVYLPDQQIKRELTDAAKSKDTKDAQDDDFCLIASAISKCKTNVQFNSCIKGINDFQKKYGKTITGSADVKSLLRFYDDRQEKIKILN